MHTRYDYAVVIGKFEPFHAGHQALIQHAADIATGRVHVLLVCKDDDTYDPHTRALSIYETFPMLNLKVHIVDDIYTDDSKPESHALWARYTKEILGFKPQVVVASEDYGQAWADAMGSDFVMFDQARLKIPVSGTLCRKNASAQSDYLPAATKRYTLPRIVVLGAESTGTTTLAKDIARDYGTSWVPELGHQIGLDALAADESVEDSSWNDGKFWLVSRGQDAAEERLSRQANRLLVCDTDSYATSIWYKYYMAKGVEGFTLETLRHLEIAGLRQAKKHSLYIVTSPVGVEFEDDGTRTGENLREWMHEEFIKSLSWNELPFVVVEGDEQSRLDQSVIAIDKVINA